MRLASSRTIHPRVDWTVSTVTAPDGAQLRVFTYESPNATGSTPTVLMAHGWTLDHRSWEPVAARLAYAQDVRVVAWDQRGHGGSTLAGGGRKTGGESVRALGDDLLAVLGTIPAESDVVLAGHSMGGMTVMAFAGLHPDVLTARARGVVLVSTAAGKLRGTGIPGEKLAMRVMTRVPLRPGRLVTARSQQRTSFGVGARREDIIATCSQIGGTSLATTATFYRALMAHDEMAALPALNEVGTSILVGSLDLLTPPKLSRTLAQAMPNAHLTVVPNAGHMLTYEAPDVIVSAIRSHLV